jgi:hypothetical protein
VANEFELAEAYTEFTVRDAKFQKGLKSVEASLERTKQRMQAVARAAKVMLVAAAGAMVLFVKEAADAEETASKFNAVFKDQAAATEAWATSFADDVGRSRFAMMDFAASLQAFLVPMGLGREESTELSKVISQLAVDLASFHNASEPETLALLRSGLSGSSEAVERFGINIKAVALNQELLNMGVRGGIKEATEQQKVLARINLMLSQTADAHGDAARTAGSLTNQIKSLKADFRDMSIEIGKELIPIAKDLVTWLKANIDTLKGLALWTVETIKLYGAFALKLGAAIVAVRLYMKVLAAVKDAMRAAAAAQAILLGLSGPGGWIKLAAGAAAAAAAVWAVSEAFDSVEASAQAARDAAADANMEVGELKAPEVAATTLMGAGGLDEGSEIIKKRALEAIKEGELDRARAEIAGLDRRAEDIAIRAKQSPLKADPSLIAEAKATRELQKELRDAFQKAEDEASAERAKARERFDAEQERNKRIMKPFEPTRLAGGSVGIEQLQSTIQRNIMQNEKDKIKWAKDTATTLAEIQQAGIKITNIEDFEPRWE